MAYWLLKSEPEDWSFADQVARGQRGEPWNGVRNAQARNFMREIKKGDQAFFYHTGKERQIVGIVDIARGGYDDPNADGDWLLIDVVAREACPQPVSLSAIKKTPELGDMLLVRNPRLSVQPVTADEWLTICEMAGFGNV